MKVARLKDIPLTGLKQGIKIVEKYTQALLVFNDKWKLVDKKVRKDKAELPVIAVIGPSEMGAVVHFEVGFRRFLPYRRANKTTARDVFIPARFKIWPNLYIDWEAVLPELSLVMEILAGNIIKNWRDWENQAGFPYYFVRSFRTRADYVKKFWLPPKDGITFHVSEFNEYLQQILFEAEIYTNHRFHKKLKGLLGVIHVIQGHFNLYNDIYKKSRLDIIRTVIGDSTLSQVAQSPEKFKALLSFSYREGNRDFFISKPQEFVNFLRRIGYLSKGLWQDYLNFCADIEIKRNEYRQRGEFIARLTNNLQVSFSGIKNRQIKKKTNGCFLKSYSHYYSFKVYYDKAGGHNSNSTRGSDAPF